MHLRPAPVARMMTGTVALHADPDAWLAREVAVSRFLAERAYVAIPPTDLLPPGPHERGGLWMTLWEFVTPDDEAPRPEPAELGRSLRELHAALADFPGDLPPLSGIRDWLEELLGELALDEREIDALRPTFTP